MSASKSRRQLWTGLAFLSPNIVGFLAFTLIPLVMSLMLAFSNWDLKLHNRFKHQAIEAVGFDNFVRLLSEASFWRFFGNTLFLMIGIPFCIGGSLFAAVMLSRDLRGGRVRGRLIVVAMLATIVTLLIGLLTGVQALTLLLLGVLGGILIIGTLGGESVYRTLFYMPHFVSGVATYLLWKKIFAPTHGPINDALKPILDQLAAGVQGTPARLVSNGGMLIALVLVGWLLWQGLGRMRRSWQDGDVGSAAVLLPIVFMLIPAVLGARWWSSGGWRLALVVVIAVVLVGQLVCVARGGRDFRSAIGEGFGSACVLGLLVMVGVFLVVGLGQVVFSLPAMAADGLSPPAWLHSYDWAKPSMMIVGVWGAIGSNNMLLYLAALTNVPRELYEAADIDGATARQRFWNVTWPQLAPTTFFIVVMSTIGGIQGGFEMARSMTSGGPAGATTTLSYFIYTEGFETGRLGYASAISWTLFAIVFTLTLFNWKFGNRYVNE